MRRFAVESLHKPKLAKKSRLGIAAAPDGVLGIVNGAANVMEDVKSSDASRYSKTSGRQVGRRKAQPTFRAYGGSRHDNGASSFKVGVEAIVVMGNGNGLP